MRINHVLINGYWYFMIDPDELKTIEDYETLHREYWRLIADEKLNYKPMIRNIDKQDCNIDITNTCFACEYAYKHFMKQYNKDCDRFYLCMHCPIKIYKIKALHIGFGNHCCNEPNGLYGKWIIHHDPEIAKQISELKFTEPDSQ